MEPRGTAFLIFTNTSPVFKGLSVLIVGILALLYSFWLVRKWREPLTWQFKVFICLAVFIVIYGSFILVFQPHWWNPPWWKQ